MAPLHSREPILERFRQKIAAGHPLLCAATGNASAAAACERAGVDLILLSSAFSFNPGNDLVLGLLPYGNANEIVNTLGPTISSSVPATPLIAGICPTDPMYGRAHFLRQLQSDGFCGIQNEPTLSVLDGEFRAHLEHSGITFAQEAEAIASARQLGLLTIATVCTTEETRLMIKGGADIISTPLEILRMRAGTVDSSSKLQEIAAICKAFREDIIVLARVSSRVSIDQLRHLLKYCPELAGFQISTQPAAFPNEAAFTRHIFECKKLHLEKPTPMQSVS